MVKVSVHTAFEPGEVLFETDISSILNYLIPGVRAIVDLVLVTACLTLAAFVCGLVLVSSK